MLSLGMNAFINAQGFANIGMMTVSIGAVRLYYVRDEQPCADGM